MKHAHPTPPSANGANNYTEREQTQMREPPWIKALALIAHTSISLEPSRIEAKGVFGVAVAALLLLAILWSMN